MKKIAPPGAALTLRDYHLPAETDGSWSELLRRFGPTGVQAYLEGPQNLLRPLAEDEIGMITTCANPFLWGAATLGYLRVVRCPPKPLQEQTAGQEATAS